MTNLCSNNECNFYRAGRCYSTDHLWISCRAKFNDREFPTVVCLCGSTRFGLAFRDANLRETLAGNIVLTIGCDMRSDAELFKDKSGPELTHIKLSLDVLHKRKIDLADEVLILNVGGYVGESTMSELGYALKRGKRVRWLEPDKQIYFGQNDHPDIFTPILDCEHKDSQDGCCNNPVNSTPECHVSACPRLDARIDRKFNDVRLERS